MLAQPGALLQRNARQPGGGTSGTHRGGSTPTPAPCAPGLGTKNPSLSSTNASWGG